MTAPRTRKPPLPPEIVEEIRAARAAGATPGELAQRYDRAISTIKRLCAGVNPPTGAGVRQDRAPDPRAEAETRLMWERSVAGWTQAQIGAAADPPMTQQSVSNRLKAYRESVPPETVEMITARETEVIAATRRRLFEIMDGTDDNSEVIAAVRAVIAGSERLAKLLGLDKAPGTAVDAAVLCLVRGIPDDQLGEPNSANPIRQPEL